MVSSSPRPSAGPARAYSVGSLPGKLSLPSPIKSIPALKFAQGQFKPFTLGQVGLLELAPGGVSVIKNGKGFDGSDAMVCPFGGIVANELTLESPLADLVKLRFGLQGLRAATDPAFGAVAGGLVHPRNPNKPLVGLGQTFAFYCKEGGEIYALRPVNLSLTSSFAAHRTPTLQDQNTSGTHRLGMRDVTASLEVLWDDELIPQNFRAGDRIAFLHVAGRRSEYYHANWSPLAFNAVVFGMPACSIDNVEESENEDEKKLTLSLVGEAGDYGVAQANAEWGWDDELSFCELGSANTA